MLKLLAKKNIQTFLGLTYSFDRILLADVRQAVA